MSLRNLKMLKKKTIGKIEVSMATVKMWYYQDEMSYAFTLQQFIEYLEKFRNIKVVL